MQFSKIIILSDGGKARSLINIPFHTAVLSNSEENNSEDMKNNIDNRMDANPIAPTTFSHRLH